MVERLPHVIAIDGPSASGKGTVSKLVAGHLGFHFLDSGALYRLVALAAIRKGVALHDETQLAALATSLDAVFKGDRIIMEQEDVSDLLRAEEVGAGASRIAVLPRLRAALLDRQRAFRVSPGLVADGRDMGTVVFPDAVLKIYLTAAPEERARRRYKQLIEKGMDANMATLLQDIRQRDERDSARAAAPLQMAKDAALLDTTALIIPAVVEDVLAQYAAVTRVP
jgi:cytidylate kinase